jgi:hypothetical protein
VGIVFDRGGWSPELFDEMVTAGFDFMTSRTGKVTKEPARAFSEQTYADDQGVAHPYDLADRRIRLRLTKTGGKMKTGGKKTLLCRQVVRRTDTGHQSQIVTSLMGRPAAELAFFMFNRWRQENYFRFALERRGEARCGRCQQHRGASADHAGVQDRPRRVEKSSLRGTPTRLPLATVRPGQVVGRGAQARHPRHSHGDLQQRVGPRPPTHNRPHVPMDEARALLREAFNAPGDLEMAGSRLVVRLDPLSAPRRTRALAALCEELTAAETTNPGLTSSCATAFRTLLALHELRHHVTAAMAYSP